MQWKWYKIKWGISSLHTQSYLCTLFKILLKHFTKYPVNSSVSLTLSHSYITSYSLNPTHILQIITYYSTSWVSYFTSHALANLHTNSVSLSLYTGNIFTYIITYTFITHFKKTKKYYTLLFTKQFTLTNALQFNQPRGALNYKIYPAVLFTYIWGPSLMLCNVT